MHFVTLIALLSAAITANAQTCYTPSGLDANNITGTASPDDSPLYVPCNTSQAVSMCCAMGNANSSLNEQCVVGSDGGICFSPSTQTYARESCTDSTWQSPSCIKLFTTAGTTSTTTSSSGKSSSSPPADFSDDTSAAVAITFCSSSNTFCPGPSNTTCCDLKQGLILNANGTTSPIFRPAKKPNYLSTDLAVALGGGGGVALLAGLLVWWGIREKRKRAMIEVLQSKVEEGAGRAEGWYGQDRGQERGFEKGIEMGPGVNSQTPFAGYDARRTVMNPGRRLDIDRDRDRDRDRYYAGT